MGNYFPSRTSAVITMLLVTFTVIVSFVAFGGT